MRLSTVKDKVLKHIIQSDLYDMSSHRIKCDLNIDHHRVITALLELQESKFITLTETSTTGSGSMRTYSVRTIDAPAYYFAKTKRFRTNSFWSAVKEFIKSYWVIIAFAISTTLFIYQIISKEGLQQDNKSLQLQIKRLQDKLDSLKRS